jgi:hypothetical protein
MFRQLTDLSAVPFKTHRIPGRIYGSDFDMGYPGYAYADADAENTGEEGKKAGNKGRAYRNDGVDIEKCSDAAEYTNGYNVGYIEDGEWLNFTVNCEREGTYSVTARVASENNEGSLHLTIDKDLPSASESASIPVTGGHQNWKTISLGKISLTKGKHSIRLLAEKGGFNLNFIELQ